MLVLWGRNSGQFCGRSLRFLSGTKSKRFSQSVDEKKDEDLPNWLNSKAGILKERETCNRQQKNKRTSISQNFLSHDHGAKNQ